ncbi:type-F conjugative transfer system pilin acetylase TraX [Yersinia enterocolitica]
MLTATSLTAKRPLLSLSPLQRDAIKVIAFMAMAADHIATAIGVGSPWFNLVGRCAFPLFALVSGCNLAKRKVSQASLNRLWLMAMLAQPSYWLAFREVGLQWWQLNILFTFAVMSQVVRFLQNATIFTGSAAFIALVGYLPLSSSSYGLLGLLMLGGGLLVWQIRDALRTAVFAIWLLLVALMNVDNGDAMMVSGVVLTLGVLFYVYQYVPASSERLEVGSWFALAYVLHLAMIAAVVMLMS